LPAQAGICYNFSKDMFKKCKIFIVTLLVFFLSWLRKYKSFILTWLFLLSLVSAGTAFYFYRQSSAELNLNKDPQKAAQEEVHKLIERVSRLIVLPEDEEPTVATVSDLEKLKDQPFFASAKVGYKLFIYSQAKKAILYDPVADKIVEVAPLNIDIDAGKQQDANSGLEANITPETSAAPDGTASSSPGATKQ
jgi:hypothetical protein